jgi:2,3-bisphosphoglycerate-independent phosphoglycerate mutase
MPKGNYSPVVLVVLDGWGNNPDLEGNAIATAKKPFFDKLENDYNQISLAASGINVGLVWGEVGNSEVGHFGLGTGSVIYQSLPRISISIEDGSFFEIPAFHKAIKHVKKQGSSLHVMGLFSSGGIHSHLDHLWAVMELAKKNRVKNLYLHLFPDGRDAPKDAALANLAELRAKQKEYKVGEIATIVGRQYAMDRNNNWDRTQVAYEAMVQGKGEQIESPEEFLQANYKKKIYDEEMPAAIVTDKKGQPLPRVQPNDALIFFNYRPDRARQITKSFILPDLNKFERGPALEDLSFVAMTEYEEALPMEVAFPPQPIETPLAWAISEAGLKQYHIAETEKYAHVTFFFNGGRENPFPGETHEIVPSPAVPTYDLKPEMSAAEIRQKAVAAIKSNKYDFILINFANADMVGHTGIFKAGVKAIESIDKELEQVVKATVAHNGACFITADHGNAEIMFDPMTKVGNKEHTTNPVPFYLVTKDNLSQTGPLAPELKMQIQLTPTGILADIGPTVLDLLGAKPPKEMTGSSLLATIAPEIA